jgi:tetratricopeptide (TPR) repeat protein
LAVLACLVLLAPEARADLAKADALRNAGKYAEAVKEYESLQDAFPDSAGVLYGLAYCLTFIGDQKKDLAILDRAGAILKKLVASHGGSHGYRFWRGYWAFTASRHNAAKKKDLLALAEKEYKAALDTYKSDAYLAYLGQVYNAQGRPKDARFIFGVLVPKYPQDYRYALWLGQAEAALAAMKAKAGDAATAQVHEKAAVEAFLKALGANPNCTSVYMPLNRVFSRLRKEKRYDEAMALLRRILACKPHPWIHGWSLWELAANQTDKGDYQGAIKSLVEAEKGSPAEAMFPNSLALNYLTVGESVKAVDALRRAGKKNPKLLYSWENLGHTLASLGKIDEARESFRTGYKQAQEVARSSPRADMRAEAELYRFLFVWYLDQLEENKK